MQPDTTITTVQLTVPFHDVDSLQVVWHGHYLKYLEIARTEHLDRLGATQTLRDLDLFWVVIESHLRHVAPLRYQQQFNVACWLSDIEYRIRLLYRLTDAETGQKIAKGSVALATLDRRTNSMIETPPALLACLGQREEANP